MAPYPTEFELRDVFLRHVAYKGWRVHSTLLEKARRDWFISFSKIFARERNSTGIRTQHADSLYGTSSHRTKHRHTRFLPFTESSWIYTANVPTVWERVHNLARSTIDKELYAHAVGNVGSRHFSLMGFSPPSHGDLKQLESYDGFTYNGGHRFEPCRRTQFLSNAQAGRCNSHC